MRHARNGLVRIGFVNTLEHKAVRDCFSGLLRFIADVDAPWEVKAINPHSATDALSPPRSTLEYIARLKQELAAVGNATIGTAMGRYYGMTLRDWRGQRARIA